MTTAGRALAAVLLHACGCGDQQVARVEGPGGERRLEVLLVDVARTAEERARGLVGRAPLSEDEGLLLEFPVEGEACIVNRGVPLALDLIYADDAGAVVAIERGVPADDAAARCHAPVRHVLEVRAGVAAEAAPGDRFIVD